MDSESPIRYSLTRRQRLIPHLRIWGPAFVPFYVLLEAFFVARFIFAVFTLEWLAVLTFGALAFGMLILFRGLVTGLVDVVVSARREMDITIEDNGLGILIGSERWYLFLDGITKISDYTSDAWTIEHWNGSVVHIPKDMISDEQLGHMQKRMKFGRTAEGTAATIERGRQIQAIYEQEHGITMKKKTETPPDGPHKELFADGTVSGEGRYKDGKRHGEWKFYLRTGQLKATGKYIAGELDGRWEWWRENGQPLQAGAFKNGVQIGLWKRYYENGQLWDEGSYENGKKTGEWITYDKDGIVKQKKTFKAQR